MECVGCQHQVWIMATYQIQTIDPRTATSLVYTSLQVLSTCTLNKTLSSPRHTIKVLKFQSYIFFNNEKWPYPGASNEPQLLTNSSLVQRGKRTYYQFHLVVWGLLYNIYLWMRMSLELTYEIILQTTPLHSQNSVNSLIPMNGPQTFCLFFSNSSVTETNRSGDTDLQVNRPWRVFYLFKYHK